MLVTLGECLTAHSPAPATGNRTQGHEQAPTPASLGQRYSPDSPASSAATQLTPTTTGLRPCDEEALANDKRSAASDTPPTLARGVVRLRALILGTCGGVSELSFETFLGLAGGGPGERLTNGAPQGTGVKSPRMGALSSVRLRGCRALGSSGLALLGAGARDRLNDLQVQYRRRAADNRIRRTKVFSRRGREACCTWIAVSYCVLQLPCQACCGHTVAQCSFPVTTRSLKCPKFPVQLWDEVHSVAFSTSCDSDVARSRALALGAFV